jgi:hypothetical protein
VSKIVSSICLVASFILCLPAANEQCHQIHKVASRQLPDTAPELCRLFPLAHLELQAPSEYPASESRGPGDPSNPIPSGNTDKSESSKASIRAFHHFCGRKGFRCAQ